MYPKHCDTNKSNTLLVNEEVEEGGVNMTSLLVGSFPIKITASNPEEEKFDNESSHCGNDEPIDEGKDERSNNNVILENDNGEERLPPLKNSSRLKGYFGLSLLSGLAFISAYESDGIHKLNDIFSSGNRTTGITVNNSLFQVYAGLPADPTGRIYAIVVAGVSAILNVIILLLHYLDSLGLSTLRKIFRPGSKIECAILIFGMIWWITASAIMTSIRGIAGDGRGQFNLYFSTWLCLITNVSMFEMWLIDAGHSSIFQSISSFPNRAPGWIMIFACAATNLICILDLFNRHEEVKGIAPHIWEKYHMISIAQWGWLIFACSSTFTTALGFSIVELFRRREKQGNDEGKGGCESQVEGICLAILVIIWLPSVVIATTDGAASDFGNTYFFTWASAVVVIQTFITWLQDWRSSVHEASLKVQLEYQNYRKSANKNNLDRAEVNNDNDEGLSQSNSAESHDILGERL